MSADPFWLCLHLDRWGYPCNRRTMKPLSMCSLHREAPASQSKPKSRAAYQRARKAALRNAGVSAAFEGVA